MPVSPIDNVLAAARAALQDRLEEANERVARVKAAADAYLLAIEQDLAAQFAQRFGLEYRPTGASPLRAALDLRAVVEALPEAHVRPGPGEVPTPSVPPPGRASLPPPEPRPSREPRAEVGPTNPLTDELLREVRAANLDEMPTELFRVHAEEYAARARHLQELLSERSGDVDALGRVIRTLTAMVSKRGLTGIYGLSRSHAADWQARADDAARRRQRMLSLPPNGEAAAGSNARGAAAGATEGTTEGAVEPRAAAPDADDEAAGDEVGDAPLELSHLAAATSVGGAVVIVGGAVKPEKLARLRRRCAVTFEWVGLEHGGSNAVAALEKRIRDGRLAGLVVLQELIAHKHFDPLLQAARQTGLPWAYGGKAGKASLESALWELESTLAQRASAAGSPA